MEVRRRIHARPPLRMLVAAPGTAPRVGRAAAQDDAFGVDDDRRPAGAGVDDVRAALPDQYEGARPFDRVTGQTRGWKHALNALTLYYGDRITLN